MPSTTRSFEVGFNFDGRSWILGDTVDGEFVPNWHRYDDSNRIGLPVLFDLGGLERDQLSSNLLGKVKYGLDCVDCRS
jgi:hypothetical protein